jgi:hypothetical protein
MMSFTPISYRTKLKNIAIKYPWITKHQVKPTPGHVDLIVRLLDLCEMAMGTQSPVFSVFQVKYLKNSMRITAIPSCDVVCDIAALRNAIELTLRESSIVCPHCGDYQTFGQSLKDVYVCCPASGDLVLWEAIPDLMAMHSEERDAVFEMVIAEEDSQRLINPPATQ